VINTRRSCDDPQYKNTGSKTIQDDDKTGKPLPILFLQTKTTNSTAMKTNETNLVHSFIPNLLLSLPQSSFHGGTTTTKLKSTSSPSLTMPFTHKLQIIPANTTTCTQKQQGHRYSGKYNNTTTQDLASMLQSHKTLHKSWSCLHFEVEILSNRSLEIEFSV
jgi:hypothetical protein